jgi:hypothetical protein
MDMVWRPSKPGFAASFLGFFFLSLLLAARVVGTADANSVSFFGRPWNNECVVYQKFGRPCPGCGLTRSVLLTLHGNISQAARLNIAGVAAVLGMMFFSLAMLVISHYQSKQSQPVVERMAHWLRTGTLVYGSLTVVLLFGHWFLKLTELQRANPH